MFFKLFNVYSFLREREREHKWGRGREREGDTGSETDSSLWAVRTELDAGPKLTNHEIMTWAEGRCWTDWATQRPYYLYNVLTWGEVGWRVPGNSVQVLQLFYYLIFQNKNVLTVCMKTTDIYRCIIILLFIHSFSLFRMFKNISYMQSAYLLIYWVSLFQGKITTVGN